MQQKQLTSHRHDKMKDIIKLTFFFGGAIGSVIELLTQNNILLNIFG